jgi:hypothetical protein
MMKNLVNAGKAFKGFADFTALKKDFRQVIIYSEGNNYWPYLKDVVFEVLNQTNLNVCYISSSLDDKGLKIIHPQLRTFYVGIGNICDMFFKGVQADFFITSTPGLNHCKFVRSTKTPVYIYVPHAIVSLHVAYKTHAFDDFDVLCAVGEHHVHEARKLEQENDSPKKVILEFSYNRLWDIIDIYATRKTKKFSKITNILLAPTWGMNGLIESGLCEPLIQDLLGLNYEVTLRPHPETFKRSNNLISIMNSKFEANQGFRLDNDMLTVDSLIQSDLLITDWSGISLEYAFGLKKPIIFADINKKINNPNFGNILLPQIEDILRTQIGVVWDPKAPIEGALKKALEKQPIDYERIQNTYVYERSKVSNQLSNYLSQSLMSK